MSQPGGTVYTMSAVLPESGSASTKADWSATAPQKKVKDGSQRQISASVTTTGNQKPDAIIELPRLIRFSAQEARLRNFLLRTTEKHRGRLLDSAGKSAYTTEFLDTLETSL